MARPCGRRIRAFRRDRRATGAVEFALIVPFLILLYIGSLEATLAVTFERKLYNCASILGDLVSQEAEMSRDGIQDILDASFAIMQPFDDKRFGLRVSVVDLSAAGTARVRWSQASPGTLRARAKGTAVEVPARLAATSEPVLIMTETAYDYHYSLSGRNLAGPLALAATSYARSRGTRSLDCADC